MDQCSSLCLAFRPGLWICTILLHALHEVSIKIINRGRMTSFFLQNLVITYYAFELLWYAICALRTTSVTVLPFVLM